MREARLRAMAEDISLKWTEDIAFYVCSEGCVHRSKDGIIRTLTGPEVIILARDDRQNLLPIQRAVLQQQPGKADGIAKSVTCVQAIWFCSQCIARICENLAISLFELNTFAHCISTLIIYLFWWDKPYDAQSHVWLDSPYLEIMFLLSSHWDKIKQAPLTNYTSRATWTPFLSCGETDPDT